MAIAWEILDKVRKLKQQEAFVSPTKDKKANINIVLAYPSPYHIGMSSLGYQTIYRLFNLMDDVVCERTFLPENTDLYRSKKTKLFTFESEREVQNFQIVAFSVSYETELLGMIENLELSNIPILSSERNQKYHPLVVAGGPITFSNPLPMGPFVEVVLLGEAEDLIHTMIEFYKEIPDREELLKKLSTQYGFYVPSIHGNYLPPIAKADHALLPAYSAIITPNTELSNMFLIEPERGCSRGCTFCVMRRSTNNGMRLFTPELVLSKVPEFVKKIGLVGAAVSDHPKIVAILEELVLNHKKQIGISSLRADRLTPRFVEMLALGGYKTLTVASDGPSERIREFMEKKIKEKHLIRSAELAKEYNMKTLKLYQMIGIPGETDEDIDEMIDFSLRISKIMKTAIGISPFVAKKNTPLDKSPFEGIKSIDNKLKKINKALGRYVDVRTTSAKWTWIEYQLAQGDYESGFSALKAYRLGGNFSAWKEAFESTGKVINHLQKQPELV
ncbi:MAG: radical SAM protein [Candidatus Sericytochromatia bacterium]|nr:radical SAM protein [Candidatus Sericytochromatia bacterium]